MDADGVQKPVYYTSKVLHDAKTRYSKTEKILFALVVSSQRFRPYFQAHPIVVLTDQPLWTILSHPDTSGRLAKWAIKLGEFDLSIRPRPAMRSQVLADFLVECTWAEEHPEELHPKACMESPTVGGVGKEDWILHVDGASNSQGSGAGLILANLEGEVVEYALRFLFPATNNQAEYEALLAGMKLAKELGAERLRAFTDSQLVSRQVAGEYEARDLTMSRYLSEVQSQASRFAYFHVSYIPRAKNARADALSRLATSADGTLGRTYVEHLQVPSIEEAAEEALPAEQEPS